MKTRKMKRLSYRKTKKIKNNKYVKTNKYVKKTKKQIKNKTRKNKTRKNMIHKKKIHKKKIHKKKIHKKMIDKIDGGEGKYTYNAPWYTKKKIEKIKKINAYENQNPNKTLVMAEDLVVGQEYMLLDDDDINKEEGIEIMNTTSMESKEKKNIIPYLKKHISTLVKKKKKNNNYELHLKKKNESIQIDIIVSPNYVFQIPPKEKGESDTEEVEVAVVPAESDTEAVVPASGKEQNLPLSPREQRLLEMKQKRTTKKNYEEEELNSALDSLDAFLNIY